MKVLLVSSYGGVSGGISRWTSHILDYYEKKGNADCYMVLSPQERNTNIDIDTPKIRRIVLGVRDYSRIIKIFKKKINSDSFDVMHLTTSASLGLIKDLYMLRYAKRRNVRTVIHFRFGRIPELSKNQNWEWKCLNKVLHLVDKAIVIDLQSYNALLALGYNNVVYLPNPVAPEVISYVEESTYERQPRLISFCGHVVPTKGVFELVKACMAIPDVKLRLVGHCEADIKQQLVSISNNAQWLEFTGDLKYKQAIQEMLKCDVFCLPSYTEGFPNVILESMACGCPIVTTTVGAIPEMLESEEGKPFGLLVEPKNVNALKEALTKMLDNESFKNECGNNVQIRVRSRYNIDVVWKQLVKIWESAYETQKQQIR